MTYYHPDVAGIYLIKNIIDGREYIGASTNIKGRITSHIKDLKGNRHENTRLQYSFNKYGEKAFKFLSVEIIKDINKLHDREQWWMDIINPEFNVLRASGFNGVILRLSNDEYKEKLSRSLKATWTEERRKAWSEYKKGKPSNNKGKKMPDGFGDKISKAQSGKDRLITIQLNDGTIHKFRNLNGFCREHKLDRNKMKYLLFRHHSSKYSYEGINVLGV